MGYSTHIKTRQHKAENREQRAVRGIRSKNADQGGIIEE
jgi:hypothetical protein